MKKNLIKIDMQEIAELDEKSLNVLVGGTAGIGKVVKDLLDSIDININWNCKCTTVSNNVC